MEFKTPSLKLIAFAILYTISTTAHSFSTFNTAWNPGANTARISAQGTPPTLGAGGATWSIIGLGISDVSGIDDHGGASTTSLAALNPGLDIVSIIDDAFNLWASVSGFTNLGQVADSGLGFGADESGSASFGDIRIGAIAFDGPDGTLAHAYQPGTDAQFTNGSIAGDIHIDNSETWVGEGESNGITSYDLAYVLLHEIGHALGLGHSDVSGSLLEPSHPVGFGSTAFALTDDDIAGIQSIYGAPTSVVPLPGAPILFLSALGLIGFVKRKRANTTS